MKRRCLAALALAAAVPCAAQTTWTGAASASWSDPGNWSPATPPSSGASVYFVEGVTRKGVTYDGPANPHFNGLFFSGSGYTLGGTSLGATLIDSRAARNTTISAPMAVTSLTVFARSPLLLSGGLFGDFTGSMYIFTGTVALSANGAFAGTIGGDPAASFSLKGVSYPSVNFTGPGLLGGGTLGNVDASRIVASTGALHVGSLAVSGAVATVVGAPGERTWIQASGPVQLGSNSAFTPLAPVSSFTAVPGDVLMVVQNDGANPIGGTFRGLPEGAIVAVDASDYRLSYQGGDGNDIVLVALPPGKQWTGAASNLWSDPANWNPPGVPQASDRIAFSGTGLTIVNDLPGTTEVTGITLNGANWVLSGNPVRVTAYLRANDPSQEIRTPLDVGSGNVFVTGSLSLDAPLSGSGIVTIDSQLIIKQGGPFTGLFTAAGPGTLTLANNASLPGASLSDIQWSGAGTVGSADVTNVTPLGRLVTGNFTLRGAFQATFLSPDDWTSRTVQVNGTASCTQTSGLLTGADTDWAPPVGVDLVLIANFGPNAINGCDFSGLPLQLGEATFVLSNTGGDGNDLVARWVGPVPQRLRDRRVDLDGDGRGDVLLASTSGQLAAWTMNGLSLKSGALLLAGIGAEIHATGDFDGDGKSDVLLRYPDGRYAIQLMDGVSPKGAAVEVLGAGTGWRVIALGDFNGDHRADLLLRSVNGQFAIWLMNGASIAQAAFLQPGLASGHADLVGDFDGDGRTDIVWRDIGGNEVLCVMDGLVSSSCHLLLSDTAWRAIAAPDFDGDHDADIVWRSSSGGFAGWTLKGATVTGYASFTANGSAGWRIVGSGDLDGDGRDDLIWSHFDGRIAAWRMSGLAAVGFGMLSSPATGWSVAAIRDLDGDGKKDILLKNGNGAIAAWLMNGTTIGAGAVLLNAGSPWQLAP